MNDWRKDFRRARGRLGKILRRAASAAELHDFWRRPDPANRPAGYLEGSDRSLFLMDIVNRHVPKQAEILEIGCNVGRNLHHLAKAGFTKLSGIEINDEAIRLLRATFPELQQTLRLWNDPVEDAITRLHDQQFGLVYTMAVLEHIHPDSEWIFADMARITSDVLITVEDEHGVSWRHFPRNYGAVFGALGFEQVEVRDCGDIEGLGSDFCARVFKKKGI
ncbi:MAG TPA: class I SAM-dependent methyltransferase [Vicinamibacterales bacterium]|nr:class I SAM-dependent methyltransferase [Vicinamibacterales bacterium]